MLRWQGYFEAARLPRSVWVVQVGVVINFFGNGLVGPFLLIYLHDIRGFQVAVGAAAIAASAFSAIASGLLAGWLADRVGPRLVVAAAMASNAAAFAAYTQVRFPWQAFAVSIWAGIGIGAYGPSIQSFVAGLTSPDRRHAAFAQQRISALVGLAIGGVVGGVVAGTHRPEAFVVLLLVDSATFLTFSLLLLTQVKDLARPSRVQGPTAGYLQVLRDTPFVSLAGLNVLLVAAGIAPVLYLLPAFAKVQAGLPEAGIGLAYAANLTVILLSQTRVVRGQEGRRRMPALAMTGALWAVAWLLVLAATGAHAVALVLVVLAMCVYGIGETLYSLAMVPTVADLAPVESRGRYLGVIGLTWQAGFMLGPPLGGLLFQLRPPALPLAAAGLCIAAAPLALLVERRLPASVVRTHVRT